MSQVASGCFKHNRISLEPGLVDVFAFFFGLFLLQVTESKYLQKMNLSHKIQGRVEQTRLRKGRK